MITQFPTRAIVAVCVVFVLASIGLTLFVWRSVGGTTPFEPRQYEVRALFTNASQLTPNAAVRISGVTIGKVVEVRSRGLRTEATMSIEPKYAPLAGDVRAILRQKTLLGETFVALSPGSPTGPRMPDGGTIPNERIEATQPLDRVLATLDAEGRERLQELLVDTGATFAGRAEDLSNTLGNMATGARQLEVVAALLDDERSSVSALTARVGEVLQTVGDEDAAVRRLVREGRRALSASAARDAELTETVRAAPAFLRELRDTSRAVERTAVRGAPTVRAFKPVAPKVEPALAAMQRGSTEIDGLLTGLNALMPTVRRSLPAASSLINGLGPFMDQLQPAAQQVTPMLSYIAAYRKELVSTMANVAASAKGEAAGVNGQRKKYLRTIIPIGPEGFVGANGRNGSNRHNAYMAPGGLDKLSGGLLASNCANAGNTATASPPCKVQGGWSFEGSDPKYFHRLTPRPVVPEPVERARAAFG